MKNKNSDMGKQFYNLIESLKMLSNVLEFDVRSLRDFNDKNEAVLLLKNHHHHLVKLIEKHLLEMNAHIESEIETLSYK